MKTRVFRFEMSNSDCEKSIRDLLEETSEMEDEDLSGIFTSENRYEVLSESHVNKHGGQVNKTADTRTFTTVSKKRHRGMRDSIDLETFQSMNPDMKLNVLFEKINNVELSQDCIKQVNE